MTDYTVTVAVRYAITADSQQAADDLARAKAAALAPIIEDHSCEAFEVVALSALHPDRFQAFTSL